MLDQDQPRRAVRGRGHHLGMSTSHPRATSDEHDSNQRRKAEHWDPPFPKFNARGHGSRPGAASYTELLASTAALRACAKPATSPVGRWRPWSP
jgi:hypothetical protein